MVFETFPPLDVEGLVELCPLPVCTLCARLSLTSTKNKKAGVTECDIHKTHFINNFYLCSTAELYYPL
jgi:hypothetical protein